MARKRRRHASNEREARAGIGAAEALLLAAESHARADILSDEASSWQAQSDDPLALIARTSADESRQLVKVLVPVPGEVRLCSTMKMGVPARSPPPLGGRHRPEEAVCSCCVITKNRGSALGRWVG